MNFNRKIQLAAAAVAVNGALALGFLYPSPALATTCGPQAFCQPQGVCEIPSNAAATCAGLAPAGCTYASSYCSYPSLGGCSPILPSYLLTCVYR
jgi:hypothetical protein